MAALVDHLWQSWLCLVAIALLLQLLGRNPARVRLWLWSVAALKFIVPCSLVYAIGAWLGFPVDSPADPAPSWLITLIADLKPWLAPAQAVSLSGGAALAAGIFMIAVSVAWSRTVAQRWRFERALARREHLEEEANGEPSARPVGFFKAAAITSLALSLVAAALATGAVADRQRRYADINANLLALRNARLVMTEAAPGMGTRTRVFADEHGVSIRNANLQDLLALAFGVTPGAVFINQMISSDETDPRDFWMLSPRYDLRIEGPVREPARFEPYALHPLVTRLMADRFAVEIEVNGICQAPCGRQGIRMGQ